MLWSELCLLQKSNVEIQTPPYLRTWLYLEMGTLQRLKWGQQGGSQFQMIGVLIREEQAGHRYTQREDPVKTQGEEGHLVQRRGLRRNQPCQYLHLRLLASNCVKINFCGVSPCLWYCYSSPSKPPQRVIWLPLCFPGPLWSQIQSLPLITKTMSSEN